MTVAVDNAGFFLDPPAWIQVLLWLAAVHFVVRAAVQGILRSPPVRMWMLCRLRGRPQPLLALVRLSRRVPDLRGVVVAWLTAQEAGVPGVALEELAARAEAGESVEAFVGRVLAAQGRTEAVDGEAMDHGG